MGSNPSLLAHNFPRPIFRLTVSRLGFDDAPFHQHTLPEDFLGEFTSSSMASVDAPLASYRRTKGAGIVVGIPVPLLLQQGFLTPGLHHSYFYILIHKLFVRNDTRTTLLFLSSSARSSSINHGPSCNTLL